MSGAGRSRRAARGAADSLRAVTCEARESTPRLVRGRRAGNALVGRRLGRQRRAQDRMAAGDLPSVWATGPMSRVLRTRTQTEGGSATPSEAADLQQLGAMRNTFGRSATLLGDAQHLLAYPEAIVVSSVTIGRFLPFLPHRQFAVCSGSAFVDFTEERPLRAEEEPVEPCSRLHGKKTKCHDGRCRRPWNHIPKDRRAARIHAPCVRPMPRDLGRRNPSLVTSCCVQARRSARRIQRRRCSRRS